MEIDLLLWQNGILHSKEVTSCYESNVCIYTIILFIVDTFGAFMVLSFKSAG